MPDRLTIISIITTVTTLITSPPGQVLAGGVLGGIVWKFFERLETLLAEQTKFEVAVWLVGLNASAKVPWPDTFTKVINRLFGDRHLTFRCFVASLAFSLAFGLVAFTATSVADTSFNPIVSVRMLGFYGRAVLVSNCLPDYLSLLKTRLTLRVMSRGKMVGFFLIADLLLSAAIGLMSASLFGVLGIWFTTSHFSFEQGFRSWIYLLSRPDGLSFSAVIVPVFSTSIWLWLYAGSGFLLKASRRFDLGFQWFNRKFDIEKNPLQCIGLVAGALVACLYWTFAIVSRWV
jgi:hypothetical protein